MLHPLPFDLPTTELCGTQTIKIERKLFDFYILRAMAKDSIASIISNPKIFTRQNQRGRQYHNVLQENEHYSCSPIDCTCIPITEYFNYFLSNLLARIERISTGQIRVFNVYRAVSTWFRPLSLLRLPALIRGQKTMSVETMLRARSTFYVISHRFP